MPKTILYQVNVGIEGLTPLLQHKCGVIEKGKVSSPTTSYDEEWKKTVYLSMSDNVVCIPSINIEAMIRDAGRGHKVGKMTLTKILTTGTEIVEFEVPILVSNKQITLEDIEEKEWLFSCAACIKKDRIMRTRAMIPTGWKANFNIRVTNPLIKKDVLQDTLERAGYEQGLMDWRPGAPKPGKFGQFELYKFDVC